MKNWWKVIGALAAVLALAAGVVFLPSFNALDFSNVKMAIRPTVVQKQGELLDTTPIPAPPEERKEYLNEFRATEYLNYATRDYYNGSYEEAMRRLDRAKSLFPGNYGVFKLSGQINFEKSHYRSAYNDWARATQLPNDDQAITRDLAILKKLITYCRNEMDRLQKTVNKDPTDRISRAKLKELEARME